jgi:predicted RNase H-like HicB family nuclease
VRQVVIHPGEDGYRVAECPSLPGCVSQGKIREEAITNIKEAIQAYVESLEKDGPDVPEDKLQTRRAIIRQAGLTVGRFLKLIQ